MENVQGANNVVRLSTGFYRGLMDNDGCSYRLYTAWSQHRDLDRMIEHYMDLAEADPTAHVPEVSSPNPIHPANVTTFAFSDKN